MITTMTYSSWIPFGSSVRGASHIRAGKENQDAFLDSLGNEKIPSVIAVSDGHGGNKYIRSAKGAELACLCAVKILGEGGKLSPDMREEDQEGLIRHIKSRYLLEWQKEVDAHAKANPFTESEKGFLAERCGEAVLNAVLDSPKTAYGCTFLCAAGYGGSLVLILQLGDGDVLGLYEDGEVRELMDYDPRNFANGTLSLCSLGDASDIAHNLLSGTDVPVLITLSTDGVKNSYDDRNPGDIERFYQIPTVISNELRKNDYDTAAVRKGLEGMLERVTSNGAGDDVTIGVLFNGGL
ncbi:MAG: protein phosphatase 2C domain-containing protein [Clostridiales bacterium]|jgi:hypothetical protein|nr:protein phosphatase 2C domain-containing protein [Clostridiales bacterium]